MRVVWTRRARDELNAIFEYLLPDSEAVAVRTVRDILRRGEQLENFPNSGRSLAGERYPQLREVFSGPYRLIYRVSDASVDVLAIRHGRRALDPAEIED